MRPDGTGARRHPFGDLGQWRRLGPAPGASGESSRSSSRFKVRLRAMAGISVTVQAVARRHGRHSPRRCLHAQSMLRVQIASALCIGRPFIRRFVALASAVAAMLDSWRLRPARRRSSPSALRPETETLPTCLRDAGTSTNRFVGNFKLFADGTFLSTSNFRQTFTSARFTSASRAILVSSGVEQVDRTVRSDRQRRWDDHADVHVQGTRRSRSRSRTARRCSGTRGFATVAITFVLNPDGSARRLPVAGRRGGARASSRTRRRRGSSATWSRRRSGDRARPRARGAGSCSRAAGPPPAGPGRHLRGARLATRAARYGRATNALDFRVLGPLQVAANGSFVPLWRG